MPQRQLRREKHFPHRRQSHRNALFCALIPRTPRFGSCSPSASGKKFPLLLGPHSLVPLGLRFA
jgi:hypothetical protein